VTILATIDPGKTFVATTDHANSAPPTSWIQKTLDVCGGDPCIRNRRIPVWLVVRSRQLGMSDPQIRGDYDPPLSPADLDAAWQYYNENRAEIEEAIRRNEEA
jgi:uncharacterized protein (DUF433 family)